MENITPQKTADEKKQLQHIRQSIYALLISLILVSGAFGVLIKISRDDLRSKDLKISTIISEVGDVKADLNKSIGTVNGLFNELEKTKNTLNNLNNNVVRAAAEKEMNWSYIQKELNIAQENLNNLLMQKEDIINELSHKNELLKKETNIVELNPDTIDVLILGHNANQVDTIMLASANPESQKIHLISLPRDLYHKGRKINELYGAYGIDEVKKAVYEISGIYPDKYILFGLDSFVDLIDMIGGVEINVEKPLKDMAYPGPDFSYSIVSFNAGIQTMDGQTALKYARSRKSTSDFDRSLRQQQIISAVKEKALKLDLLGKLDLATKIYAKVSTDIQSDISLFDALGYLQSFKTYTLNGGNVISTANYLYSTTNAKGQYILLPKEDSYWQIKEYIGNIVSG